MIIVEKWGSTKLLRQLLTCRLSSCICSRYQDPLIEKCSYRTDLADLIFQCAASRLVFLRYQANTFCLHKKIHQIAMIFQFSLQSIPGLSHGIYHCHRLEEAQINILGRLQTENVWHQFSTEILSMIAEAITGALFK